MEMLGERILPVLARSLELPKDFFAPFFANEAHINLRALHYPPRRSTTTSSSGRDRTPTTRSSRCWRARRCRGLAVRLPSGEWLAPPVIEDTFLVNLGNVMKRWSNDRFLSTPHGVLNDSGRDRYSIAFFYSPNPDARIEVLRRARAPTTLRATSRRCTATSCCSSTTPTTSTARL